MAKFIQLPPRRSTSGTVTRIWTRLEQRACLAAVVIPLIALISVLMKANISERYDAQLNGVPQAPPQSYREPLRPLLQHLAAQPDAMLAPVVDALLHAPPISFQEARRLYSQHLAHLDR